MLIITIYLIASGIILLGAWAIIETGRGKNEHGKIKFFRTIKKIP